MSEIEVNAETGIPVGSLTTALQASRTIRMTEFGDQMEDGQHGIVTDKQSTDIILRDLLAAHGVVLTDSDESFTAQISALLSEVCSTFMDGLLQTGNTGIVANGIFTDGLLTGVALARGLA